MPSGGDLQVIVCTHGDCRRAREHRQVLEMAARYPGSATVPCQGICDGPVVGVRRAGELRWYRRISRKSLTALAGGGGTPKKARKLEVRKRRGALRHARRLRTLA